jgi:hypothetical protein
MRANKPSEGSVEGARAQLEDLRQFVIDKKLVSIPSQEQALVAESPPRQPQATSPSVSIPDRTKARP